MRDHPPIPITQLGLHIEHLRSNNNNSFTREYEVRFTLEVKYYCFVFCFVLTGSYCLLVKA